MDKEQLTILLHHLDGQLGLAMYRTVDEEWHQESAKLRVRIEQATKWLDDLKELGDEYGRGYEDGKQWTADHLIRVANAIRRGAVSA